MTDKNLGHATAYGYAKSKGYTGTEEEFAELMASYADVAESAKGYAEQAEASASNASTSETNARASASTASTKASEASASASNAQASATSAGTSASSASASAQTASTKASEASDSATSASESASTAVSAKDDAVTAKEEAETAKADAETAAEEAQESAQTVANKADKDGTYPDMTVGGVLSSDGSTDSTPYLYRESGGGVEVGTVEEDSIVGGTVAWNQQLKNGNFADGTTDWIGSSAILTVTDGVARATLGGKAWNNDIKQNNATVIAGHIYLIGALVRQSSTDFSIMFRNPGGQNASYYFKGTEWMRYTTLIKAILSSPNGFALSVRENGTTLTDEWFEAQNINCFDLTQMFGTSVADYIYSLEQSSTGAGVAFFRKLFPKDYYEYNTGELMSVEGVSAHVMRDADDNIIGNYPLDSSLTLRGIPKLSDGLYFDGDTYEADGTVTRKYGVVDLGTLNWRSATDSTGQYFVSTLSPTAKSKTGSELGNNICSKYPISASTNVYDGSLAISNQGTTLYVRDTSYTDATAFKSAMSGVMLVYELATPTTESAEPYDSIQKVSKYGTEEYVSTGIVPVGHVTKYPTDIVAKVNGLPSDFSTLIAPTESAMKASKAYTANDLIIVNNQLYRATTSIANGATITVGTNVTATTVADILTQLLNV